MRAITAIYENQSLDVSESGWGNYVPDLESVTMPSAAVGSDALHKEGITGDGVTIAIIDTGIAQYLPALKYDSNWEKRIAANYDAIAGTETRWFQGDPNGHGSHITGVAVGSDKFFEKSYDGVAADADVVIVTAFDKDGRGTYLDVIRGIDWVVAHKNNHNNSGAESFV